MLSQFFGIQGKNKQYLHAVHFGIAAGLVWGVLIFIVTLLATWLGQDVHWLLRIANFYPGYEVNVVGSFIGLMCGFIDGFIVFFLIAQVYNKLGR